MSRAEAMEEYDGDGMPWELYEQTRRRAIEGKPGQRVLRELRDHLRRVEAEIGPRLAYDQLADASLGVGCVVGEYIICQRMKKGETREAIIAELDGQAEGDPEETVWRARPYGITQTLAYALEYENDIALNGRDDPEGRYRHVMAWIDRHIKEATSTGGQG